MVIAVSRLYNQHRMLTIHTQNDIKLIFRISNKYNMK